MNPQNILVALIILAALVYIARRAWRKTKSLSAKSACAIDCGCGKKS